eukprot:CAMPEP_0206266824 /NCGR_PEP_ID=MMETSP0047_2-20121206/30804_1 /ASSEMBLY_ACC=CAM_ASM_000192 /TAXON_ID=195065 /ORGANISM="Chroomonas mesostigmatica_cf, Strain CCMP1168" /LENGTH=51 /DNA_ID=CAMNT_0053694951 /DNA_START=61 /DNA_END=212 /DNA_ORIENTATION=-
MRAAWALQAPPRAARPALRGAAGGEKHWAHAASESSNSTPASAPRAILESL